MADQRQAGGRSRGQGLAEFALILPLVLFTIFVLIELARVLHAWISVENAARFGVRYAITGEYDLGYCGSLYGGPCDTQPKQDGARLPSIRDAANSGAVGILKNAAAAQGTPGFWKITICSNKPGLIYFPSDSNTNTPADCQPQEDGGGPGDRVIVTVDFDHPLIAPIVSSTWPQIHLSAKREGIGEQFRVARIVGLPATIAIPTFTATVTPTMTETPIASATVTPTVTPTLTLTVTPTATLDCSLITTSSPTLLDAGGAGYFYFAISDVALKDANLDEVPVTGHEIGHYVLEHTWMGIAFFTAAAIFLFLIADRTFPRFARLFGSNARLDEPRGLPVLLFMASLFGLLATPLFSGFARMIEWQADNYSLRTENKPDALASALVKTAEYRYPRPSQIQELLFYDHPSVERRVRNAMEWKARHPEQTSK